MTIIFTQASRTKTTVATLPKSNKPRFYLCETLASKRSAAVKSLSESPSARSLAGSQGSVKVKNRSVAGKRVLDKAVSQL